jgi:hypothetical protein
VAHRYDAGRSAFYLRALRRKRITMPADARFLGGDDLGGQSLGRDEELPELSPIVKML